ncbi:MAG: lysylphosphatidylglycerol synthetase [Flavobacteriaceae bacterium]|nr:MAG: lysylphosphatidylglycerol synthetase [Flavobacteriaceae bacterium]
MAKKNKKLLTALKVVISALLIYFIFTKINLEDVLSTIKKTHLLYFFLALFFFVVSKIIAATRLNLYFHLLNVLLSHISNLQLYLLGMFYNLFLPGGIGGDAYKGYVIQKKYEVGTKKVVSVLVLDRLSGLLLLFIFACLLTVKIEHVFFIQFKILILIVLVLSVFIFWFLNKKFFNYTLPLFWKSFGYSALVQLAQLISIFFILKALNIEENTITYLFIFLISSIVSVLPLTIGGIGSREITFLYGALWLGLDESTSISISMLFFIITAIVSLFGIFYHFKKPELVTVVNQ